MQLYSGHAFIILLHYCCTWYNVAGYYWIFVGRLCNWTWRIWLCQWNGASMFIHAIFNFFYLGFPYYFLIKLTFFSVFSDVLYLFFFFLLLLQVYTLFWCLVTLFYLCQKLRFHCYYFLQVTSHAILFPHWFVCRLRQWLSSV